MLEQRISNQAVSGRNWSDQQRDEVRREMARILSHPTFKTSNRCIDLLRYVVKRAKAGDESDIKERTLGIEVFGREANYDVATDPIVRRVASDIRKRLAQYYQEEPNGHAVKIHLSRGGYLPEFEFLPEASPEPSLTKAPVLHQPDITPRPPARVFAIINQFSSKRGILALSAILLICAAAAVIWRSSLFASPIQRVWQPLLDTNVTILVCLPDNALSHSKQLQLMLKTPPEKTESPEPLTPAPATSVFQDMSVANSIITLVTRLNKQAALIPSSAIKYQDFQHGPVVLIGGENNPWVQASLSKLRYSIRFDSTTREWWVQDELDPSSSKWRVSRTKETGVPPSDDFAVLTRVFNEETGQWIVALSGLTFRSTQAAGELVTNPEIAKKIPLRVRAKGNFQIVLHITLVGGDPGPIEVVAVHTW